jgi:ABC-type sugar transport system substrate-binding protein
MNQTYVIRSKCGKVEEYYKAKAAGWLIAQRINKPAGYLVIRCQKHITDHARRQAGQK